MAPSDVPDGGVDSSFWMGSRAPVRTKGMSNPHSDAWAGTTNPGRVSFTTHQFGGPEWVNLGFNPSQAIHTYGCLWTPGRNNFTVDGQAVRPLTASRLRTNALGYIMVNTYSGNGERRRWSAFAGATSVSDSEKSIRAPL